MCNTCVIMVFPERSICLSMSHFKAYNKHELSTIDMLSVSQKKIIILHPYLPSTATSPQRPLSFVHRVAVVERFDCIQFELQHNFSSW